MKVGLLPLLVTALAAVGAVGILSEPLQQDKATGDYCVLCNLLMTELDNMLGENATETQIGSALGRVCSILPSSLTADCDQFVTMYSPVIMQLLLNNAPQYACTLMGLCSA